MISQIRILLVKYLLEMNNEWEATWNIHDSGDPLGNTVSIPRLHTVDRR